MKLVVSGKFSIYGNGCVHFCDIALPSFPIPFPFLHWESTWELEGSLERY